MDYIKIQEKMNKVILKRLSNDGILTTGSLMCIQNIDTATIFICKTIEMPWKDNAPKISCIPVGDYECAYTFDNHTDMFTYEVLNVPDRTGIRIRGGEFTGQLLGSILFLSAVSESETANKDQVDDETISKFEQLMDHANFMLSIS